jgi:hypothetical protein
MEQKLHAFHYPHLPLIIVSEEFRIFLLQTDGVLDIFRLLLRESVERYSACGTKDVLRRKYHCDNNRVIFPSNSLITDSCVYPQAY